MRWLAALLVLMLAPAAVAAEKLTGEQINRAFDRRGIGTVADVPKRVCGLFQET